MMDDILIDVLTPVGDLGSGAAFPVICDHCI
jgi:hypothetical protein